jgi:hypothetical protein
LRVNSILEVEREGDGGRVFKKAFIGVNIATAGKVKEAPSKQQLPTQP